MPLKISSHPKKTVTATPAKAGEPIASTPAAIISTLSTIDHVVALRISPVIAFAIEFAIGVAMTCSFHNVRRHRARSQRVIHSAQCGFRQFPRLLQLVRSLAVLGPDLGQPLLDALL